MSSNNWVYPALLLTSHVLLKSNQKGFLTNLRRRQLSLNAGSKGGHVTRKLIRFLNKSLLKVYKCVSGVFLPFKCKSKMPLSALQLLGFVEGHGEGKQGRTKWIDGAEK